MLVINVTAHSHVVPFKLVTCYSDSFLCWSPLYVQCKIWILKQNQPRTTNVGAVRWILLKTCQCFGFEYVLSQTFLVFDFVVSFALSSGLCKSISKAFYYIDLSLDIELHESEFLLGA